MFRNNEDATFQLFHLLLPKGAAKEKTGLVAKAKQRLFDRRSHSRDVATLGAFSEVGSVYCDHHVITITECFNRMCLNPSHASYFFLNLVTLHKPVLVNNFWP